MRSCAPDLGAFQMTFKGPIQQIVPLLEKLVPLVVSVPLPNADIGLVLVLGLV